MTTNERLAAKLKLIQDTMYADRELADDMLTGLLLSLNETNNTEEALDLNDQD